MALLVEVKETFEKVDAGRLYIDDKVFWVVMMLVYVRTLSESSELEQKKRRNNFSHLFFKSLTRTMKEKFFNLF